MKLAGRSSQVASHKSGTRLLALGFLLAACASTDAPEPWVWGIDTVDLGGGYVIGPCEGDADQIACIVADDSVVVGAAERLVFPADTFEFLEGVDDPVESVELMAADYEAIFADDRQTTCPHLEYRALERVATTVSGEPGLRHGFEELDGERVVEKNLIHAVRIGDEIHIYGLTAISEEACVAAAGELTDPTILDLIAPSLADALAVVASG
ncbi:MAG: hypothetical protein ACRDWH_07185 [Acidimicrobiia bacterium]